MDALLGRGPRRGPLGLVVGAYAVIWGAGQILSTPKLRKLTFVPFVLSFVFYLLSFGGIFTFGDDLVGWLWTPDSEVWWQVGLWWVAVVLLIALSLLVMVLLFATVVELVGGPFFDKMAMLVLERHGVPTREPGFIEGTFPDLVRSLAFVCVAIPFLLLGLIPGIGAVFAAIGTGIAWLGLASGAVNPSLVVTEHTVWARLRWVRRYLFTGLGLGAVISTALLVPIVGLVALPAAIVGAAELHARQMKARNGAFEP